MNLFYFVSDLHGHQDRFLKLFSKIEEEKPQAVFWGGELLPAVNYRRSSMNPQHQDFINQFLKPNLEKLKETTRDIYPSIFLILGNDDPKIKEAAILDLSAHGLLNYVHNRNVNFGKFHISGYACIPPSPFSLKDWERYDVSRYVDPGCLPVEEGYFTVPVKDSEKIFQTIEKDLAALSGNKNLQNTIFLFHSPPYQTNLDRAGLDGKMVDHAPLDVHIGSIAIKRFIEKKQPLITLHGHVHESTSLTGSWSEKIGRTFAFNAAHDGPELSLIRFDPEAPEDAGRELI